MSRVNILIIEDELYYVSQFQGELETNDYKVIDIVSSDQALAAYYATEPDILIININMRGSLSGLDIAKEIYTDGVNTTPVIFITDDKDSMLFSEAKQYHPAAYLLKPFDLFSLKCAVELAANNEHVIPNEPVRKEESGYITNDMLFVRKNKKIVKVPLSDIAYIEVESKYSTLVTAEGKFLVRISLKELLDKLPKNLFLRVHRNYIVNLNSIIEFDFEEYTVKLPQFILPIGRSYRNEIFTLLPFLR